MSWKNYDDVLSQLRAAGLDVDTERSTSARRGLFGAGSTTATAKSAAGIG